MIAPPPFSPDRVDAIYRQQRARLAALIAAQTAQIFARSYSNQNDAISAIVPLVEAGQQQTASLVAAYIAMKAAQASQAATPVIGLDLSRYTIAALRNGIPADLVYGRAFNSIGSEFGVERSQKALDKIVRTDLQLAQTHAARDAMSQRASAAGEFGIIGYHRTLTGPGTHCALCTAASTRTYKIANLMPIHEHCTCTVTPIFGRQPIERDHPATPLETVVVDVDPEIGPRLMDKTWAPAGPRLAF